MKIGVAKTEPGRFALSFDASTIEVDERDLKTLWMRIEDAIHPEEREKRAERYKSFLVNLTGASDAGIQNLLRTAAHDDILVLLHSSEDDDALKKKLYRNMSQNSMKMYIEDLLFEFREGVPGYRFDDAMLRLIDTVEKMVSAGTISFPRDAR
jgi:flagellar motor switch protein FliG